MALMPIAALASSPVERSVKNLVGSRNSLSHTAGCNALSIRPSIRSTVRFCNSMKAAETTLVMMTARETWTIRLLSALGTYTPSTLPVAMGTRAPRPTVTSPARARLRRSSRVPRRLKRIRRHMVMGRSGSGR